MAFGGQLMANGGPPMANGWPSLVIESFIVFKSGYTLLRNFSSYDRIDFFENLYPCDKILLPEQVV